MPSPPRSKTEQVQSALWAAGLIPYILDTFSGVEDGKVAGRIRLAAIVALRKDVRFQEGIWHLLHPKVGKPRTEFRSNRGELQPGVENSMQIVINLQTGAFEADLDRYNTQDVVNIIGHLFGKGGVIPNWFKRFKDPTPT